jgi:5-methyltetrahydrofolate--homocysteine methyltransferase
LRIIGESINDSVPSTNKLYEAGDIDGIVNLAKSQDEKGAHYIDVNVGLRTPQFMADMVKRIQSVTTKPLSIDTPDPAIAEAGLKAYDPARAGGTMPLLNSISPLRPEMFDLYKIQPFMPILLVSERVEEGGNKPNHTAEQTYDTTREMFSVMKKHGVNIPASQCIVDTGIAPIGSDSEGQLKRVLDSIRLIHNDPLLKGIHMSVGLSNFTVMLPQKTSAGMPVKSSLESAFLTLAVPLGLDMIIGSVVRKYEILPHDHPAVACLNDCVARGGFDAIARVMEFYG